MLTTDHLTLPFKEAFSDSKKAKKFASRRTKTSTIINKSFAPQCLDFIVEHCISHPYSVGTDGSSDTRIEKMNPICVKIFIRCQQIKSSNNPFCRYVFNIWCWWFVCRRYIYCYWRGICQESNSLEKLRKFECRQHKRYYWKEQFHWFKILGAK